MGLRLTIFSGMLAVAVPAAGAAEPALVAPRRMLVVTPTGADASLSLPARVAGEFAARLWPEGGGEGLLGLQADAREAAAQLQRGECEAVVVLGGLRPAPLRAVAERTFAGTLGREFAHRPAYLMLAGGGEARARQWAEVFVEVLRALAPMRTTDIAVAGGQ